MPHHNPLVGASLLAMNDNAVYLDSNKREKFGWG